jgi:hypothetical protein
MPTPTVGHLALVRVPDQQVCRRQRCATAWYLGTKGDVVQLWSEESGAVDFVVGFSLTESASVRGLANARKPVREAQGTVGSGYADASVEAFIETRSAALICQ